MEGSLAHERRFDVRLKAACRSVLMFGVAFCLSGISPLGTTSVLGFAETPPKVPAELWDSFTAIQREDAGLHAIVAVNADKLVCVGDRGAILTTDDGGRNWRLQESGVTCPLSGVCFQDANHGWVVGGTYMPYSQRSAGVVLATADGGKSWKRLSTPFLPKLSGIRIQNGSLIAWGDWSVTLGSAVFESRDQGRSWSPLPNIPSAARQFVPYGNGAIVLDKSGAAYQWDTAASVGLVRPGGPNHWQKFDVSDTRAVAVNGNATPLLHEPGNRWRELAKVIGESESTIQLKSACIKGDTIWVAGIPGSIVWRSKDLGKSWEGFPTESGFPIEEIHFVDNNRGWAIGGYGQILATRDGGESWWPQRQPSSRVAVLAIHEGVEQIQWPAVALTTFEEQRQVAILLSGSNRGDLQAGSAAEGIEVVQESATYSGVGLVIEESLPTPNPPIASVSNGTPPNADSLSQLDRSSIVHLRLVQWIRALRPDMIVFDGPSTSSNQSGISTSMLLKAVEAAADDTQLPTSWGQLRNLPPWRVSKVVATSATKGVGFTIHANQVLRSPGKILYETLQSNLCRLNSQVPLASLSSRLVTLSSSVSSDAALASMFGGVTLDDSTRRKVTISNSGNLQIVMGSAARQRMVDRLFDKTDSVATRQDNWDEQLETVCRSLPSNELEPALMRLSEQLIAAGSIQRWQRTLEKIIQLDPTTGAAERAWTDLFAMAGSLEVQLWVAKKWELDSRIDTQEVKTAEIQLRDAPAATPFQLPSVTKSPEVDRGVITAAGDSDQLAELPSASLMRWLIEHGRIHQPVLMADPAIALPLAAWTRRSATDPQQRLETLNLLRPIANQPGISQWSLAALREAQLVAEQDSPKAGLPIEQVLGQDLLSALPRLKLADSTRAEVYRTTLAPHLDGDLSDECWLHAKSIELQESSPGSSDGTTVRFAYDGKWLYAAIECNVLSPEQIAKPAKERKYDSDLRGFDQVKLMLDVDRDYVAAFELRADERGMTSDRCWKIDAWNPKWFVARGEHEQGWTLEIAVELQELVDRVPVNGDLWGLHIERISRSGVTTTWPSLELNQRGNEATRPMIFR